MRSALVTGITGQDGGYLAEQLCGEGVTVHGILRNGERPPEHLTALGASLVLHELELDDEPELEQVVRAAAPDEVYNLAGVSSVALSWSQPTLTAHVNAMFVARLLELLLREQDRRGQAIRLVQASSAEIFAGTTLSPQDERTPVMPLSPYGASKAFAHHLVQVFRGRGVHAVNAVLYNHESPRRPPTFVTRKITSTVAAIARGEAAELVLGNLDARRDWGWAPEYVSGLVLAARAEQPDDWVLATGVAHSVADFVAAAFARVGVEDWSRLVRTDSDFRRPADAAELVGDASKARERLGWHPTVPFQELVGLMVDAESPPAFARNVEP
jgi:GDPmannose 4,6-dehydratase